MEKNQIVRIKYCDYADLCSECVRFSVSGMKIISGTAHRELAERIAQSVGIQLTNVTVNTFPDGESFVKINENIRGKDVFLIQPTCPPTNHNIMELCVMVDAARRASAGRITAVVPFFGYARQDRKDQPRVPITAKLVANLLTAVEAAHERDMVVVALTGGRGGLLAPALRDTDVHICVPSEHPARVHEVHQLVLNALCDGVDVQLLGLPDEPFTEPESLS